MIVSVVLRLARSALCTTKKFCEVGSILAEVKVKEKKIKFSDKNLFLIKCGAYDAISSWHNSLTFP